MRLIDADALLKKLDDGIWYNINDSNTAWYAVKQAPTVDAVPVRYERWVHHPEIGWGSTWLCSECGEKTVETVMGEPGYKFCPMCGADMRDGDGNHDS